MLQIVLKETDLTSSPLTRNLTVMTFVGTDATMDKLPVLVQVVKLRKRNVLSYIHGNLLYEFIWKPKKLSAKG